MCHLPVEVIYKPVQLSRQSDWIQAGQTEKKKNRCVYFLHSIQVILRVF